MRRHLLALLLAGWGCTAAEPTAAPAPARPADSEPKAADLCRQTRPDLREVAPGRLAACHFIEEP